MSIILKLNRVKSMFGIEDKSNLKTIFHITHWKAGSQWIKAFMNNLAPERVISPKVTMDHFMNGDIEEGKIYATLYLRKDEFDSVKVPKSHIKFFIMRDLRDTLISYYFSLRYSHGLNPYIKEVREELNNMSQEDGMIYLLDKTIKPCYKIQTSWLDSGIKTFKYEDLILYEHKYLKELGQFLEFNSSDEEIENAINKSSFKNASKGRKLGDEDIKAHARQGLPGDWKNYFNDRIKDEFKARFSEHLVKVGYEENSNW